MIQHPAILALLFASLLLGGLLLYAAGHGVLILRAWQPASGSERQLALERRTYLISTILGVTLPWQLLSLFLFIYIAEDIHSLFAGAMCAAGSLNANGYGYPTLMAKIGNCLLSGVWLIVNQADTRGYDYPLLKIKYFLLALLAPLVLVESGLQWQYFSQLRVDVITSCCGSLFSTERAGLAGELLSLPHGVMEPIFFVAMAMSIGGGVVFWWRGRGGYLFSFCSTVTFLVAATSVVSFICLYFYELPTHHCPFCLLQKEYGYVGYLLYAALLLGAIMGMGVGVLAFFRQRRSLLVVVPQSQRAMVVVTVMAYLLFTALVSCRMLFSSFTLGVS